MYEQDKAVVRTLNKFARNERNTKRNKKAKTK